MNDQDEKRCNMTRRDALRIGAAGAAGILLPGVGAAKASTTAAPAPRARSVIQVWLWGGPSHLDTFDPKPEAGSDYTGKLDKAVDTNVSGVQLNAALPKLAQCADKYSLLRGMTHGINGHETASYVVMSGWNKGDGLVHPSVGAVVSHERGYDAGYTGLIPPYVTLVKPQGRFSEAGFLGPHYQPFATGGDPSRIPFEVEGVVLRGLDEARQKRRRSLLGALDTMGSGMQNHPLVGQLATNREEAYSLILGEARNTFDVTKEPPALLEAYGKSSFGRSCLIARKLVEAGVPFVTINAPKWDTHKKHFDMMNRLLPELDAGLSSLITDLEDRGLLDSTIVWCGGEFGRTPKIQYNAPWNGGRSHYGKAFSHLVAGGGFKGGQVVGATDARGEKVIERAIYPWDLTSSVYELMGIDYRKTLRMPDGQTTWISPLAAANPDLKTGGLLREIM